MSQYEDECARWKRKYEEEVDIVNRCWSALGISSYSGANGLSIYEHISNAVKDANRYRWLRDKSLGQYQHPIAIQQRRVERGMQYIGPLCGEELDKNIDAAIGTK